MSLPVKFGVELEFVGPGIKYLRHLFNKRFDQDVENDGHKDHFKTWSIGTDPSVFESGDHEYVREDRFGMELRTPILKEQELIKIRRVTDALAPMVFISKTSGMHLHISCDDEEAHVDLKSLAESLEKKYRRSMWKLRKHYCRSGTSVDHDGIEPKYHVVRRIKGNHVEIRIFNGTMDYKVIAGRVRDSIRMYRKAIRKSTRNDAGYYHVINGFDRPVYNYGSRSTLRRVEGHAHDSIYDNFGELVAVVYPRLTAPAGMTGQRPGIPDVSDLRPVPDISERHGEIPRYERDPASVARIVSRRGQVPDQIQEGEEVLVPTFEIAQEPLIAAPPDHPNPVDLRSTIRRHMEVQRQARIQRELDHDAAAVQVRYGWDSADQTPNPVPVAPPVTSAEEQFFGAPVPDISPSQQGLDAIAFYSGRVTIPPPETSQIVSGETSASSGTTDTQNSTTVTPAPSEGGYEAGDNGTVIVDMPVEAVVEAVEAAPSHTRSIRSSLWDNRALDRWYGSGDYDEDRYRDYYEYDHRLRLERNSPELNSLIVGLREALAPELNSPELNSPELNSPELNSVPPNSEEAR